MSPEEDSTPALSGEASRVSPDIRVGDEITFKFEGNIRARVEGFEVIDGKVRLDCCAFLGFLVPYSHVICVEREE